MENPLKNWSQKDWLYAGGAVASIVALVAFAVYQNGQKVAVPSGTVTDMQNGAMGVPQTLAPISYVNQNVPDLADALPTQSGADTAPDTSGTSKCGGCCDKAGSSMGNCTGPSPLTTGNTFSSLDHLIDYYQTTNPNYVALQELQLQKYAALFASGESYSRGGINVGVAGVVNQ